MSNLAEQVKEWLDWEELHYTSKTTEDNDDIFFFGVGGNNSLKMLFLVENDVNCIQFRVVDVLDDEDKEILQKNENNSQFELMKYLLDKNYEKRFGKWAVDFDDWTINFSIVHYEKEDSKIPKSFFRIVRSVLFDDVDNMLTDIKNIIRGKEPEDDVDLGALLELLKSSSKDSGSV